MTEDSSPDSVVDFVDFETSLEFGSSGVAPELSGEFLVRVAALAQPHSAAASSMRVNAYRAAANSDLVATFCVDFVLVLGCEEAGNSFLDYSSDLLLLRRGLSKGKTWQRNFLNFLMDLL